MTTLREELEQIVQGNAINTTLASRLATTFNELSDFMEKLRIQPRPATNYLSHAIEEVSARLTPKQTEPEIRQAILDALKTHMMSVCENRWEICTPETKEWFLSVLRDERDKAVGRYEYYTRVMGKVGKSMDVFSTATATGEPQLQQQLPQQNSDFRRTLNRNDIMISDNRECPKCGGWGIETVHIAREKHHFENLLYYKVFIHNAKSSNGGGGDYHRISRITKDEYEKFLAGAKVDKRISDYRYNRITPAQFEVEVDGKKEPSELARKNPPRPSVRGGVIHDEAPKVGRPVSFIEQVLNESGVVQAQLERERLEREQEPEREEEQEEEPTPETATSPHSFPPIKDTIAYIKDLENLSKSVFVSVKPLTEEPAPITIVEKCPVCQMPGLDLHQKVTKRDARVTFWRRVIQHPKTKHNDTKHRCYVNPHIGVRKATPVEMQGKRKLRKPAIIST